MHGEGDVLEHDEGVSDGDASQEEVDWAEMEKPAKYYPPASASLSALIFGAKNCHTRIKQYVGCICRIAELLVRFKIRLLFHTVTGFRISRWLKTRMLKTLKRTPRRQMTIARCRWTLW